MQVSDKKNKLRVRRRSPVVSTSTLTQGVNVTESSSRAALKPPRKSGSSSSYPSVGRKAEDNNNNSKDSLLVCNKKEIITSSSSLANAESCSSPRINLKRLRPVVCQKHLKKSRLSEEAALVSKKRAVSPVRRQYITRDRERRKTLLAENQENDPKLSTSPVVLITSEVRMKAELAAMKLRKGQRIEESDRLANNNKDFEDSDSTSSSEYEDSQSEDDDKTFKPAKTYPLRKKPTASPSKTVPPPRPVSSSTTVSSNDSTESSSESLPDLDFPFGNWAAIAANAKAKAASEASAKKTSAVVGFYSSSNGAANSEGRTAGSTSTREVGVMGSNQSQSSKPVSKYGDDASSSKKANSSVAPRSLRSSDGLPKLAEFPSSSSAGLEDSSKSNGSRHSPLRASPERSASRAERTYSKVGTSSQDAEKSYSLRCLDRTEVRRQSSSSNPPSSSNPVQDRQNSVDGSGSIPVQKRGRGRPRKNPVVIGLASSVPISTPVSTGKSTPLTRSQRRAGRPAKINDNSNPEELVKNTQPPEEESVSEIDTEESVKSPKILNRLTSNQNHDRSKPPRNALALRAKQSRIMAKTRVRNSNKNNVTWKSMKIRIQEQHDDFSTDSADDQPPAIDDRSGNSEETENGSSSPSTEPTVSQLSSASEGNLSMANVSPKARCEVCNMTFTRRFSLTKHLLTIQHHKKAHLHRLGLPSLKPTGVRRPGRPRNSSIIAAYKHQFDKKRSPPGDSHQDALSLENPDYFIRQNSHEADTSNRSALQTVDENSSELLNGDEDDIHFHSRQRYDEDEEDRSSSPELEGWTSGKVVGKNNFECDVCGKKFQNKLAFSSHLWNHRDDADLTCTVCGMKFVEGDKYNLHIDSAHIDETKYSCRMCPSKFNREDYLMKHEISHKLDQGERFRCTICEKRIPSQEMFRKHLEQRHQINLTKSKLELFGCPVSTREEFGTHPNLPEYITCDNSLDFCDDDDDIVPYANFGSSRLDRAHNMPYEDDDDYEDLDTDRSWKCGELVPLIPPEDYCREIPVEICSPNRGIIGNIGNPSLKKSGIADVNSFRRRITMPNLPMGCGSKINVINANGDVKFNPFQCRDCRKVFQNKRSLLKHVNYFTRSERHNCHTCKMSFKFKHHLSRHLLKHTSQKDTGKPQSLVGLRKPSFLKYHRKLIPKGIPSIQSLVSHTTENQKLISSCGPPFHDNVNADVTNGSESKLKTEMIEESEPGLNSSCISESPNQLATAASATTSVLSGSSSSMKPKVIKTWSVTKLSYKPHTCELCSKTFTEKKTLDVHMCFHQKENLLNCPDCEAKCERKNDLELHLRCHVKRTPFFLCYVCFKPFRWKKDMIRHVRKKHPEERTYRCLYCHDKYRTSEDLAIHVSDSHPEHRSFPCDHCGRRYAQKRYLIMHIQNQHGSGGPDSNLMLMSPNQIELQEEDLGDGLRMGLIGDGEEGVQDELGNNDCKTESAQIKESSSDVENTFNLNKVKVEHHL
jgi:hypothetical protein